MAIRKDFSYRYIDPNLLAMRIDLAEKQSRLEREGIRPIDTGDKKEDALIRRLEAATYGDTTARRVEKLIEEEKMRGQIEQEMKEQATEIYERKIQEGLRSMLDK